MHLPYPNSQCTLKLFNFCTFQPFQRIMPHFPTSVLHSEVLLWRHTSSITATLNTALSPHHTNATDCDNTQLHLYVSNFLTLWAVWQLYSSWSVSAYCTVVTEIKCAENTFIMEECTSPVKHKILGWSVAVLPEILEFFTCYCNLILIGFPFSNQHPSQYQINFL
jgi:hypothetical protein